LESAPHNKGVLIKRQILFLLNKSKSIRKIESKFISKSIEKIVGVHIQINLKNSIQFQIHRKNKWSPYPNPFKETECKSKSMKNIK